MLIDPPKYPGPVDRFHARIDVVSISYVDERLGPCWCWNGRRSSNGYGRFYLDGREVSAHRFAWQLYVAPLGRSRRLDHVCRVRSCVNPAHLRTVAPSENERRKPGWVAKRKWTAEFCIRGHPLAGPESDVYLRRDGGRSCNRCRRIRRAEGR